MGMQMTASFKVHCDGNFSCVAHASNANTREETRRPYCVALGCSTSAASIRKRCAGQVPSEEKFIVFSALCFCFSCCLLLL